MEPREVGEDVIDALHAPGHGPQQLVVDAARHAVREEARVIAVQALDDAAQRVPQGDAVERRRAQAELSGERPRAVRLAPQLRQGFGVALVRVALGQREQRAVALRRVDGERIAQRGEQLRHRLAGQACALALRIAQRLRPQQLEQVFPRTGKLRRFAPPGGERRQRVIRRLRHRQPPPRLRDRRPRAASRLRSCRRAPAPRRAPARQTRGPSHRSARCR